MTDKKRCANSYPLILLTKLNGERKTIFQKLHGNAGLAMNGRTCTHTKKKTAQSVGTSLEKAITKKKKKKNTWEMVH
jgi:hypothetical protein